MFNSVFLFIMLLAFKEHIAMYWTHPVKRSTYIDVLDSNGLHIAMYWTHPVKRSTYSDVLDGGQAEHRQRAD